MGCLESKEKDTGSMIYPTQSRLRLLLVGDSGVGKTSLMDRYVDDKFSHTRLSTIGIDYKNKTIKIGKSYQEIQIWDTAGQERFRSITRIYYRGANGVAIVFDLTSFESFLQVQKWFEDQKIETSARIIVGNKSDSKHRVVSERQASDFALGMKVPYFETSALSGVGVTEMFEQLATLAYEDSRAKL